jgi:hypothetical protein
MFLILFSKENFIILSLKTWLSVCFLISQWQDWSLWIGESQTKTFLINRRDPLCLCNQHPKKYLRVEQKFSCNNWIISGLGNHLELPFSVVVKRILVIKYHILNSAIKIKPMISQINPDWKKCNFIFEFLLIWIESY